MDLPLVVSHCPMNRLCATWTNRNWKMLTPPDLGCLLPLQFQFSKIDNNFYLEMCFEGHIRPILSTNCIMYVRRMQYWMRMALLVLKLFGTRTTDADIRRVGQTSKDEDTWDQSCIERLHMERRSAFDSPAMCLVGWPGCNKRSGIDRLAMKTDWRYLWLDLLSSWLNMMAINQRCETRSQSMAVRIAAPWKFVAYQLCLYWYNLPQVVGVDALSHDVVWNFCALHRSTNANCCVSCRDLVRWTLALCRAPFLFYRPQCVHCTVPPYAFLTWIFPCHHCACWSLLRSVWSVSDNFRQSMYPYWFCLCWWYCPFEHYFRYLSFPPSRCPHFLRNTVALDWERHVAHTLLCRRCRFRFSWPHRFRW